jgi:acyl-coenzyme A thioesterase PaaI-like protein
MTDHRNILDLPGADYAPPSADWAARRTAAAAARRLIEQLVTTTSSPESLLELAAVLDVQTTRLAQAPQLAGRKGAVEFDHGRLGNWAVVGHELSPLGGHANPLAPQFEVWIEGAVAHGRTRLGWPYEGPPGSVHGGFVCAIFDHFLGMAQRIVDQPGVTGTLTTRFHRPTPLHTDLELIGHVESVSGRKTLLRGEIRAHGVTTASCQGIFIHLSPELFKRMSAEGA